MKKNNKLIILLSAVLLFVVSFIIILRNGMTFTYKVEIDSQIKNINDLQIQIIQDKDIIKITDKKIDNDHLILQIKAISKGKAYIDIQNENFFCSDVFYVHNFNIITRGRYFGKSTGDIVLPVCLLIYCGLLLFVLIKKYKNNVNNNIYQYKNISYLGIIIFIGFSFLNLFIQLFHYDGLIYLIEHIIRSVNSFSIILFPVVFLVSIFFVISNIRLIIKESFTLKNMLGITLGFLIMCSTLFPDFLYRYLQGNKYIDIHNESGIALYIHQFVETFIYICVTYLECILYATIFLSIKTGRYIPKFNKDYIIILGCKIRKDGTLTPLLKGRVDRAIEFSKLQKEKTNKDIIFIPSGGKGNDEIISEAEAIKNYLIEQGIDSKKIIVENKSTNTYENIKFSYKKIKDDNPSIAFSTTNYHVFRAGVIAHNQGINMEGIGSKTKVYFFVNALIREFIATIYLEKNKHLKVITIILLFTIFMILFVYMSNII